MENDLKEKNIVEIYLCYVGGIDVDFIIALDDTGKVYSWGDNYSGQLGDGTNQDKNIPRCINDLKGNPLDGKKIKKYCSNMQVNFSYYSSWYCYITQDGKVYSYHYEAPI